MVNILNKIIGYIQLTYEHMKDIATEKQDGVAKESIVIDGEEVRI